MSGISVQATGALLALIKTLTEREESGQPWTNQWMTRCVGNLLDEFGYPAPDNEVVDTVSRAQTTYTSPGTSSSGNRLDQARGLNGLERGAPCDKFAVLACSSVGGTAPHVQVLAESLSLEAANQFALATTYRRSTQRVELFNAACPPTVAGTSSLNYRPVVDQWPWAAWQFDATNVFYGPSGQVLASAWYLDGEWNCSFVTCTCQLETVGLKLLRDSKWCIEAWMPLPDINTAFSDGAANVDHAYDSDDETMSDWDLTDEEDEESDEGMKEERL